MPSRLPTTSAIRTNAAIGLVVAAAFLALLGWDRQKHLGADGELHGPYDAWQVLCFVIVLAAAAAVGGWVRQRWAVAWTCTVVTTVAFSISAVSDAEDDGLWPVGATLVAVGTLGGTRAVAAASHRLRIYYAARRGSNRSS